MRYSFIRLLIIALAVKIGLKDDQYGCRNILFTKQRKWGNIYYILISRKVFMMEQSKSAIYEIINNNCNIWTKAIHQIIELKVRVDP